MKSVFEKVYQKYYVELIQDILRKVKQNAMEFPDNGEQQRIINEALQINCAFRFIVYPLENRLVPLQKGDNLYRFDDEITIKHFFTLIHPAYLVAYLVYARFAYELTLNVKAPWQEIIKLNFQVLLPVKLPGKDTYFWYTQMARVLTIDENNLVKSHINTYTLWREFMEFKQKPESIFIGATIFQDQAVYQKFQEVLKEEMRKYYRTEVFVKLQHQIVLKAYRNNDWKDCKYEQTTINSYNKEIIELMRLHTGYKFPDIHAVIAYLEKLGVTDF